MIEWRQVPWPLWVYSAVVLLGVVLIEVGAHGPIAAKALYPVVVFTWLFFLLKGVRWVWIFTVGINALGLVPYLISGSLDWQGIAIAIAIGNLLLLLLPVTRRYFSDGSVEAGLLGP
jgi:hypothetical protein